MCVLNKKTGFDKSLHEMEHKIHGSVFKKLNSTENSELPEIGDTVAVFISHWNRWVRGQLKEVSSDGVFFVWAVDYGVPIVSKSSEVVKIPAVYTNMNANYPRIHVGGLINCVPAEGEYDFETDNMVAQEKLIWSNKAIKIAQEAIDRAIQMKFENSLEFKPINRREVHRFGHLTCQKSDGTWTDLTKCLSNAFVAKITTDDWFNTNAYQMSSIQQPEWKTNDEISIPFNIKIAVFKHILRPTTNDSNHNDTPPHTSNQSIEGDSMAESAGADKNVTNDNEVAKNKVHKKPSAPKCYAPLPSVPQARPFMFQYPRGMKINRGFFPMQRGGYGYSKVGYGNFRLNSRDRSYHHGGRVPDPSEQEYFESCIGQKPTKPTKNHASSDASSEDEDTNVENHDNTQTIDGETKQENDAKKSNEHQLSDEMKIVKIDTAPVATDTVTVAATSPDTATPPVPATKPTSTTPPAPVVDSAEIVAVKSTVKKTQC